MAMLKVSENVVLKELGGLWTEGHFHGNMMVKTSGKVVFSGVQLLYFSVN